jgi:hypothetical protein
MSWLFARYVCVSHNHPCVIKIDSTSDYWPVAGQKGASQNRKTNKNRFVFNMSTMIWEQLMLSRCFFQFWSEPTMHLSIHTTYTYGYNILYIYLYIQHIIIYIEINNLYVISTNKYTYTYKYNSIQYVHILYIIWYSHIHITSINQPFIAVLSRPGSVEFIS